MTTSITRKDALQAAIDIDVERLQTQEYKDVLERMLTSISKPRNTSGTKSPSKAHLDNETVARELADMVEVGESIDSAYVVANAPYGTTLNPIVVTSSQKAVSVMKVAEQLGLFSRAKEGKKVVYVRTEA